MESLKKQCQMVGTMDGYEINNRVYGIGGVCPCLSARDYKDAKKIIEKQSVDIGKHHANQEQE